MPAMPTRLLPALLLLCAMSLPAFATRAAEVTIYRCVDAKGKLTLRDTPCAQDEQQQTRSMQRPQDPPPRAPAAQPTAPTPTPAEAPRMVVRTPARPLYECTTPDGERYTSDTGEGNPRWVPLWTLGYPVLPRSNPLGDRVGAPQPRPPGQRPGPSPVPPGAVFAYTPGTWVRDACAQLPPGEVCARLRDRRDEIRRRFFNAQPSERDVLRLEERGINTRLDNDCGEY